MATCGPPGNSRPQGVVIATGTTETAMTETETETAMASMIATAGITATECHFIARSTEMARTFTAPTPMIRMTGTSDRTALPDTFWIDRGEEQCRFIAWSTLMETMC
jgi:hypothetical protein